LIAHIDVVPVEGQPWTTSPFQPTEKDGFLWARGGGGRQVDGRGVHGHRVGISPGARTPLARDVIVALTAGEETGGFEGAAWLAKNHREAIDAEYALNEGGGLQLDPELTKVHSASLAVAEKVFQSYRVVARGKGGHSSVPPQDDDPVLALAKALVKIRRAPIRAARDPAGARVSRGERGARGGEQAAWRRR